MRTLIVVDMQNDFITGPLGTKEAIEIVPKVNKRIDDYYQQHDQIFFTRDTHFVEYLSTQEGKKLPIEHCIQGSKGWHIADGVRTYSICQFIDKDTFGTFHFGKPYYKLHQCESIELIGVCTDICVISNALILKAQYPEVEIIVDASCCAGTTPEMHKAALAVMKSCQINVINEENA